MNARWWSQPFAPEGSAAAEGIIKQLGRPALDPLTVLVREAAQNSWDARLSEGEVQFRIDVRMLGDDMRTWREFLLPGPPDESNVDLGSLLRPETIVLVVSDRNTRGLGGPLRAGERARESDTPDFVQFLRNVGEPSDHRFGGGTYGFGKGIFYRLSRAGAILVDTHASTAGLPQARRLMGAALGHSWYLGERRFTGRHWWGLVTEDDVPDPILSAEADAVSKALGLPGFDDGRTGTDIVVLAADLGVVGSDSDARERTPAEAVNFIASSILWNLWPKMILDGQGRRMRFVVSVNGSDIPIPEPDTFDELAPFVEALLEIRAGVGVDFSRTVPPKRAGTFAMALGTADSTSTRLMIKAAQPFDGPPHHVARMRVAELVVDYLPGPSHPDSRLAYGAVFKASEDADTLFASAEPPTHDDWISKGLTGTARGVVQGARTFVQKQLDERLGLGPQTGGSGGQGLGQLSAMLAGIIPTRSSGRPEEPDDGGTAGGGRGGADGGSRPPAGLGGRDVVGGTAPRRVGKPRLQGSPVLQVHQGRPYLVATVKIPGADIERVVAADVEVVVEGGGRENEPPLGAVVPRILQWQSATGVVEPGRTVRIPAGPESDWYVFGTHVPDAVVRFRVSQVGSDAG
ncbi:hypothetical protein [Herbidospora cretacea]|uniref:hypothetical protein n=1 Tax=Herbidospora cretacea TaxID=28444 RepID=UPI000A8889F5|nr:hypothetical protein [Herbidospora cretacea]